MRNCFAVGAVTLCSLLAGRAAADVARPDAHGLFTAREPLEALRLQLAAWVPPYHALRAEGQLAGTTPDTPLPAAVKRAWQAVSLAACATPTLGPDAAIARWQARWCQDVTHLAQSPNFGAVLERSRSAHQSAEHLLEALDAQWALGHPLAATASLGHHLRDAAAAQHALAEQPLPVGHDLVAVLRAAQGRGALRLTWTPPDDTPHAPALVRVYTHTAADRRTALVTQLQRCAAADETLRGQVLQPLADPAATCIAELPRATGSLERSVGEIDTGMQVRLVPVSAFGVEGPARPHDVPVKMAWPALMPPCELEVRAMAPVLEQRDFYRNMDAVQVRWACSPSEQAAPEAAQLLRYDVYRFAAAQPRPQPQPQPHWPEPFAALSALGPWGRLPAQREYVGSVPPGTCALIDRPGATRLREGVAYVVAAVGTDEQRAIAQASCSRTDAVFHDVAPLLELARAGGDRLVHPTRLERDLAGRMDAQKLAWRRRIFAALPQAAQMQELKLFWRAQTAAHKARVYDELVHGLDGSQKQARVEQAARALPAALDAWLQLEDYVTASPTRLQLVRDQFALLPLQLREQLRRRLAREVRRKPSLAALQDGGHKQDLHVALYAWREQCDDEDRMAVQAAWQAHSPQEQLRRRQAWLLQLPAAAQQRLAYPSWAQLDARGRAAWLLQPPDPLEDRIAPAFFAWQEFVALSPSEQLRIVTEEVALPQRIWARVRYAVRPLDIWLAFERASAVAVWAMGAFFGWYGYSLIAPGRRRRPKAFNKRD